MKKTNQKTVMNHFSKWQWPFRQQKMAAAFVILTAVLLILLGSSIRIFASSRPENHKRAVQKYYTSIRIEPGDTLWQIADSYVTAEMPKKEFIREVCRLNHISENDILCSGDYLVVMYYSD